MADYDFMDVDEELKGPAGKTRQGRRADREQPHKESGHFCARPEKVFTNSIIRSETKFPVDPRYVKQ